MEWIVGILTGLVAGLASSTIVYVITKKKENKEKYYLYWLVYLFKVMQNCAVWFPIEELLNIDKVGKKGSEWYKAINEIMELTRPYQLEDREFDETKSKIAQNVIVALNELGNWYGNNKRR